MSIVRWSLALFLLNLLACSSSQDLKNKEVAQRPLSDRSVSDTPENSIDKALIEWETRVTHQLEGRIQNTSQMVQGWIDKQAELAQGKQENLKQLKFTQQKVDDFMQRILYQIELLRNLVRDFDGWVEKKARDAEKDGKNQGFDLMSSKPYQFLQEEREDYDSSINQLMLVYGYASKWAHQEEDEVRKVIAKGILNKMELFLKAQQKTFPYAVHNLGLLMNEVNEHLEESKLNQFLITGKSFLIESKEQLKKLQREALSKNLKGLPADLKKKLKDKVKKFENSLTSILEQYWPEILHPNELQSVRKPQSNPLFKPSTAADGNLTGRSFNVGEWAITLDDGPSKYTSKFLDNLDINNKECYTFFWLSKLITNYTSVVKRAGAMGCERASHSFSHANLSKASDAGLDHEVGDALRVFETQIGQRPTMFRCPYGACGARGREIISKNGMIHIFWNVDSLDWQDKNPESIKARVISQMKVQRRGVILFHDIHPQSLAASQMILDYIREHKTDLKLVTVGQKITEGDANFTTP